MVFLAAEEGRSCFLFVQKFLHRCEKISKQKKNKSKNHGMSFSKNGMAKIPAPAKYAVLGYYPVQESFNLFETGILS